MKFKLPRLFPVEGAPIRETRWGAPNARVYRLRWPELKPSWANCQMVIDVRVVLSNEDRVIAHQLRARAEAAYNDPILRAPSETAQRDFLFEGLVVGPVQAYLHYLSEHLDTEDPLWIDWHYLAGVAFWTGRTGGGLVEKNAGCDRLFYVRYPPGRERRPVSWGVHLHLTYPHLAEAREGARSTPWPCGTSAAQDRAEAAMIKTAQVAHRYVCVRGEDGELHWISVHIDGVHSDEMWSRMLKAPVPVVMAGPEPYLRINGRGYRLREDGTPGEPLD